MIYSYTHRHAICGSYSEKEEREIFGFIEKIRNQELSKRAISECQFFHDISGAGDFIILSSPFRRRQPHSFDLLRVINEIINEVINETQQQHFFYSADCL